MSKKKKILLTILTLIVVYFIWLGVPLIRFKTYESTSSDTNNIQSKNKSPFEIEGAYHMHSTCSDGLKPVDKIAKFASDASLDFIILTDHGKPNFASLACQGWKEGILVLAGSELSVSRGHLVGLDFGIPSRSFSQNAEQAANQIKALNGFSVIAHPYSKVRWSWGIYTNYSGIEIINGDTMLRKNIPLSILRLPTLLIKPQYPLLKTLRRPEKNIKKWDMLTSKHTVFAYFAVDAHMLYRHLFSLLRLHLLLNEPLSNEFEKAKNQVYNALRNGRFFNVIEGAGRGEGFRFSAKKGNKTIHMGSTVIMNSPVTLHIDVPFPFAKEVHLVHNGEKVLKTYKNSVSYPAEKQGTYRVEVYLREKSPLKRDVPWILSNPIFLRRKSNE